MVMLKWQKQITCESEQHQLFDYQTHPFQFSLCWFLIYSIKTLYAWDKAEFNPPEIQKLSDINESSSFVSDTLNIFTFSSLWCPTY